MKTSKYQYNLINKDAKFNKEKTRKVMKESKRIGAYTSKNQKVAIVSRAWSYKTAPVDDTSFDIWTINSGFRDLDRVDLLLDMHNWNTSEYASEYYKELCTRKYPFPIVVPEYNTNILSKQILCPVETMVDMAGMNFRNSIPIAIMYAYLKGYKDVYLFGISSGEFVKYPEMGFSLYYVLGFVRSRGCNVHICNDYKLEDNYFYGYQKMTHEEIRE